MDEAAMNLRVVTEHLLHMAEKHSHAAGKLIGANRAIAGVADRVSRTHGIACFLTNNAVAEAVAERTTGGENLHAVSIEFEEKLKAAADNYANVDYMAGKVIDYECRT